MKSILALATALILLCGCQSYSHTASTRIDAKRGAIAMVLGDHPRIRVENEGPGELRLQFEDPAGEQPAQLLPASATTQQSLAGPVRIRLEVSKGEACTIRVSADATDGISLTVQDSPPASQD